MSEDYAVPDLTIKIDNTELDSDQKFDINYLMVDMVSDGPNMFQIVLADRRENEADIQWVDDGTLKVGNSVEIQMGFLGGTKPYPTLIKGEITNIEPLLQARTASGTRIRGYDKLHRLTRGRQTKTYVDMTDSDIASQVATDVGLGTGGVESTSTTHPYVIQNNQTYYDFLQERGGRINFELAADGSDLVFRKPKTADSSVYTFAWGGGGDQEQQMVRKFTSRMATGQQIEKVEVRGWDVKQKKAIVGKADKGDVYSTGGGKTGSEATKSGKLGGQTLVITDMPVYSQEEADALAKAIFNKRALGFMNAELEVEGKPTLVPGKVVELNQDFGKRFQGKYYIVKAAHILNPNPKQPGPSYLTKLTLQRAGVGQD